MQRWSCSWNKPFRVNHRSARAEIEISFNNFSTSVNIGREQEQVVRKMSQIRKCPGPRSHARNMEIGPTARWCTLDPCPTDDPSDQAHRLYTAAVTSVSHEVRPIEPRHLPRSPPGQLSSDLPLHSGHRLCLWSHMRNFEIVHTARWSTLDPHIY